MLKKDFPLKVNKKSTSFLTQIPKPKDSLIQNPRRPVKLRFNLFPSTFHTKNPEKLRKEKEQCRYPEIHIVTKCSRSIITVDIRIFNGNPIRMSNALSAPSISMDLL